MVYLKKPNSLMKISPIPIGAIYFRMKISNLYICIFKVPFKGGETMRVKVRSV